MQIEDIESVLKEFGFKYQGVEHNMFEKSRGRTYLKEGEGAVVFVKENRLHIARRSSTLFRGLVNKESDIRTMMRLIEIQV